MPNVMPPKSFKVSANTLVAPDPSPPPNEAIKITMSWSSNSLAIRSFSCSAAILANTGFNPVPKPWVSSCPNKKYLMPERFLKARISVSAMTNVALLSDLPISETIAPPPPPMPMTFIFALKNDSAGKSSFGLLALNALGGCFFLMIFLIANVLLGLGVFFLIFATFLRALVFAEDFFFAIRFTERFRTFFFFTGFFTALTDLLFLALIKTFFAFGNFFFFGILFTFTFFFFIFIKFSVHF